MSGIDYMKEKLELTGHENVSCENLTMNLRWYNGRLQQQVQTYDIIDYQMTNENFYWQDIPFINDKEPEEPPSFILANKE